MSTDSSGLFSTLLFLPVSAMHVLGRSEVGMLQTSMQKGGIKAIKH